MSRDSKDAAKSKKILDDCLKLPENKICSECGGKQPRWASTNLGCFMCIRCSGIHRNLGVHISKIKSVSLDTWPLEQAEFMATMGNDKANAVWEYALPANRKPKEEDSTYLVEQFIKDKYEKRMFCKPEKAVKKGKGKKGAAAKEEPAKKPAGKAAAKKKKVETESDSESESSSESSSSESEDSEDERAAAKKKKAIAAKKKAAAAAAAKSKAKSESEESSSDDSEDERAKAKAKKNAAKGKKPKKAAEPEPGFAANFAAASIAPPATNGHASALSFDSPAPTDFGSGFDADFTGSSPAPAAATDGFASSSGGDFFTEAANSDDPFGTSASHKKVPSAAATKSIMDKFSTAQSMAQPMMGMPGGFGGMMPGMPAQSMQNMYQPQQPFAQQAVNPYMQQQYNPYVQQQAGTMNGMSAMSGFQQQSQQQAYNPYAQQQFAAQPQYGMAGMQSPMGYGVQQQQQQHHHQQQQQGNPFGAFAQSPAGAQSGGPLDALSMGSPQAQPAAVPTPAKADPFAEFGGGFGGVSQSRAPVAQSQPAAAQGGFFF